MISSDEPRMPIRSRRAPPLGLDIGSPVLVGGRISTPPPQHRQQRGHDQTQPNPRPSYKPVVPESVSGKVACRLGQAACEGSPSQFFAYWRLHSVRGRRALAIRRARLPSAPSSQRSEEYEALC